MSCESLTVTQRALHQDVELKQISGIQPLFIVLETPVLLLLRLRQSRWIAQMKIIVCVHVKWLNI